MDQDRISFTLPSREQGISALNRLTADTMAEFVDALLTSLWDAHENDELPESVNLTLLDWLAHAAFWESPVFRARLEDARRAAGF